MSPEQLCAKGTESGHQKALFAWAAMARNKGFAVANNMDAYRPGNLHHALDPVSELEWLHAIPNGGARDKITAARMKGEGVRAGVADVFLPVPRNGFHGFYIEMKKPKGGRESDEQAQFGAFVTSQGYYYQVARSWRDAASMIEAYFRPAPVWGSK